jgi:predicted O-methyltransferase YrrM
LTVGTFEENIDSLIDGKQVIDLAFIDAIHTKAFVKTQLEIVLARAAKDSIIIFDDIDFSEDMAECWREVAADERFVASLQLGNRVGIVEYR